MTTYIIYRTRLPNIQKFALEVMVVLENSLTVNMLADILVFDPLNISGYQDVIPGTYINNLTVCVMHTYQLCS